MRNPGGYLQIFSPEGAVEEYDTMTCGHCNRIVKIKHKCDPSDLGGLCKLCMKMICPDCVNTGECEPFEEKLKRMEARADALRSYGG